VVLLDAGRLADGATAGGLGAIVPEPDASYRTVESLAGRRVARMAWKETHRAALEFASTLKKLPSKSDLASATFFINAARSEEAAALRKEQALRKGAGLDAPWSNPQGARRALSTDSAGALRQGGALTYDPVRAALALSSAAAAKGARIFERSEVRRTRFTRKDALVGLGSGSIRTKGIVVATGGPGRLFGQLRRHVRQMDGHLVATHPLNAAMRRDVGARGAVVTEAGDRPHWLRWLSDDRLLFAGALAPPVSARLRDSALVQRTAQLMYELSLRYPVISGLSAAWGWSIPVVRTPDGLPWIGAHRNYPHHFFAMAFGWQGDALAWLAARAAVRFFRGETRREDEAFGFVRHL
jgi:glycine/D-amino acid oxidase-like deaminating enzyme